MKQPRKKRTKTVVIPLVETPIKNDIIRWGDKDLYKVLKVSYSENESWAKRTEAMEIEGVGCMVKFTTQQNDQISAALVFIPMVRIMEIKKGAKVIARKLVNFAG
jgi:hypothetical protein